MSATKLLKMSRPYGAGFNFSQEFCSTSSISSIGFKRPGAIMCLSKVGLSSDVTPAIGGGGERNPVAVKAAAACAPASTVISKPKTDKVLDLGLLLANILDVMSRVLKFVTKQRPWRLNIQMFIEKVIIDCRFFTLLGVAGSLLGSVLCFFEGCVLIVESYFQYFHAISQMSEQSHVMLLLIEAIDMFLVGTAMLIFGMALHVMFVGSQNSGSTLSKNFYLEKLPSWIRMQSVMQAKSKIGHAVIMILQVEVLEKFKSIPMSTGMDLACFAGVVFISSASIFVLSRITDARAEAKN